MPDTLKTVLIANVAALIAITGLDIIGYFLTPVDWDRQQFWILFVILIILCPYKEKK